MTFPTSPANGQTATVNGIGYIYNATNNAWKRQAFSSISVTGNITAGGTLTATNYFYSNSAPVIPTTYDLDEIYTDGSTNTFRPLYNQSNVAIAHPWAVMVTIDGSFQPAFWANYAYDNTWVSRTLCSVRGYTIDTDGNIKLADTPPAGSTILARLTAGSQPSTVKVYPFRPLDIMVGI